MDLAWTATAGRLILGGFFLVAGIANLVATGSIRDHIERMRGFGTPAPEAAFWSGIALQFLGAALLLSGIRADIGALCLIAFTAPRYGDLPSFLATHRSHAEADQPALLHVERGDDRRAPAARLEHSRVLGDQRAVIARVHRAPGEGDTAGVEDDDIVGKLKGDFHILLDQQDRSFSTGPGGFHASRYHGVHR